MGKEAAVWVSPLFPPLQPCWECLKGELKLPSNGKRLFPFHSNYFWNLLICTSWFFLRPSIQLVPFLFTHSTHLFSLWLHKTSLKNWTPPCLSNFHRLSKAQPPPLPLCPSGRIQLVPFLRTHSTHLFSQWLQKTSLKNQTLIAWVIPTDCLRPSLPPSASIHWSHSTRPIYVDPFNSSFPYGKLKNPTLLAWAIPTDCLRPSLPLPLPCPQWSQASKSLTTTHYSSHYLSLFLFIDHYFYFCFYFYFHLGFQFSFWSDYSCFNFTFT